MLCNLEFVNSDEFVSHGRYVEKKPGQFVADTSCEKLPKELCGKGEAGKKAGNDLHCSLLHNSR